MLSKKSKIEQLAKFREDRFSAASIAASLYRTCRKLCGRFLVIRCGPSHRRTSDAPAALKNLGGAATWLSGAYLVALYFFAACATLYVFGALLIDFRRAEAR
jgi:hypothetical protein